MSVGDEVKALGASILADTIAALKGDWRRLTDAEQALVRECAYDAAKVAWLAVIKADVSPERAHVAAQLGNIKSVAAKAVASALWGAAQKALHFALGALVA